MHSNFNTLLVLLKQADIQLCFHNLNLYYEDPFLVLDIGFHSSFFSTFQSASFELLFPRKTFGTCSCHLIQVIFLSIYIFYPQPNPDLSHLKNLDKTESNAQPCGMQPQTIRIIIQHVINVA